MATLVNEFEPGAQTATAAFEAATAARDGTVCNGQAVRAATGRLSDRSAPDVTAFRRHAPARPVHPRRVASEPRVARFDAQVRAACAAALETKDKAIALIEAPERWEAEDGRPAETPGSMACMTAAALVWDGRSVTYGLAAPLRAGRNRIALPCPFTAARAIPRDRHVTVRVVEIVAAHTRTGTVELPREVRERWFKGLSMVALDFQGED